MMESQDFTGPVNLGNPTEFTIKDLAEKIITRCNSQSTVVNKDLPQDDPKQRLPNIDLAREKLNWNPKVPLSSGLNMTIEYFKQVL